MRFLEYSRNHTPGSDLFPEDDGIRTTGDGAKSRISSTQEYVECAPITGVVHSGEPRGRRDRRRSAGTRSPGQTSQPPPWQRPDYLTSSGRVGRAMALTMKTPEAGAR